MPVNGLVTMTPSSIVSTGTGNSSSINTNGSVTFSSCDTLSLNGVFTSSYDNYMISMRVQVPSSGTGSILFRLRASGTDNSTANSYVFQDLIAGGAVVSGGQSTSTSWWLGGISSSAQREGLTMYLFGPQLTQATTYRSHFAGSIASAYMYNESGTHNQATSYDGFTLLPNLTLTAGLITVYGFNQ